VIELGSIGQTVIRWQANPRVLQFVCKADVDADGGPDAYTMDNTGLDDLDDLHQGNDWYCPKNSATGLPYIQGQDGIGPSPCHLVSSTSLQDPQFPVNDTRRYQNAQTVNFIVLPEHFAQNANLPIAPKLGARCLVVNLRNGLYAAGIFADEGPPDSIGELSIAYARALCIPDSPRNGGQDDDVLYLVYC